MELERQNVRLNCVEKKYEKSKTLDEDLNVPDSKGDINKVVCSTFEAVIENMKANDNKEAIKGYIEFDILYLNYDNGALEHLEGKYPFEESFDLGEGFNPVSTKGRVEVEDFTVRLINSRKVNIKALLNLCCYGDEVAEEEIVVGVQDDNVLVQTGNMVFAQIKADGEDSYRIKENIDLPKNKPNINRLIWSDMRLKSRETRLLEDGIYMKGDLGVFVVYEPEGEEMIQWYESSVPVEGKIEVSGVNEDMFSMVCMSLQERHIEVKPDYDGEERVISLEGMIKIDLKAYSEEEIPVLWDMYSTNHQMEIVTEDKDFQQLVMKNCLKAKGYNKVKLSDVDAKPLQICYAFGDAHLENTVPCEEGLRVEGYVNATIIYVSADDANPIASFDCGVPFSQIVNMDLENVKQEYVVNVNVDQVSASMMGGDEIEVRAYVGIELLMMKVLTKRFIKEANMTPISAKELSDFPGIIGYIANCEETLWDIAKRYKVTEEGIRKLNSVSGDTVRKGDKLLIVR